MQHNKVRNLKNRLRWGGSQEEAADPVMMSEAETKFANILQQQQDKILESHRTTPGTVLRLNSLGLKTIPAQALASAEVTSLSLEGNLLSELPAELRNLTRLEKLDISSNRFETQADEKKITAVLQDLPNLKELNISFNSFLVDVVPLIRCFDKLVSLSLRNISMGYKTGEVLHVLAQSPNLKSLDFSENGLCGFPTVLAQNPSLEFLELSYNQITLLPDEISLFTSLKELAMAGCELTSLGEGLGKCSNLETLILDYNYLYYLPRNFTNLRKLVQIHLAFNYFDTYPDFINVEHQTCKMESLKTFSLMGNNITGPGKFPEGPVRLKSEVNEDVFCHLQLATTQQVKAPSQIIPEFVDNAGVTRHPVYLGCYTSAKNREQLIQMGVKSVVTVGIGLCKLYPRHFNYLKVSVEDAENQSLYEYFEECADFIFANQRKGGVLIHCAAGISRSATIVIAYVMKYKNMTFDEAYQLVKTNRDIIQPNAAFVEQLRRYEKEKNPNCVIC